MSTAADAAPAEPSVNHRTTADPRQPPRRIGSNGDRNMARGHVARRCRSLATSKLRLGVGSYGESKLVEVGCVRKKNLFGCHFRNAGELPVEVLERIRPSALGVWVVGTPHEAVVT